MQHHSGRLPDQTETEAQYEGQKNTHQNHENHGTPKTRKQATKFPDAPEWQKAHDAELDQLDRMHAIDWHSTTPNIPKRDILPTKMSYRYKHGKAPENPVRKARC